MLRNRFVFINGLHRSGTSILFKCLREHPDFSGFSDTGVMGDEGQLLQTVFEPALMYGGPGKFGFDRRTYMDETSPLVTEENRIKLFYQWKRFWNIDRMYLLEKSPPNLIKTRFLQAMFPNSYFITILGHPIGSGLATKKWSNTSVRSLIEHWLLCHEAFLKDMSHIRHIHLFRYKEFVEDAQGHLDAIYRFLGTDTHHNELEVKNVDEKYFRMWAELKAGRKTRRDVEKAIVRFEERVNRFGYSLKDPRSLTDMKL